MILAPLDVLKDSHKAKKISDEDWALVQKLHESKAANDAEMMKMVCHSLIAVNAFHVAYCTCYTEAYCCSPLLLHSLSLHSLYSISRHAHF